MPRHLVACFVTFVVFVAFVVTPWAVTPDYPITPVPAAQVKLTDSFWAPRPTGA